MNPEIQRAIDEVFSDTSVSQTETWNLLEEIIQHLLDLQTALDDADQNHG
jgi:hypothetical protein